jgi:spore germination protein KC
MKKAKNALLIVLAVIAAFSCAGCWNYREVDKLSIVAGVAIDKGVNSQYEITAEVVKVSAGKETKITPETLSAEGKTLFDATRNIISISGKRLYWSHTKVVIICEEIARESISKVLEWYNRDAETREDVRVLISREAHARDIFKGRATTENMLSFTLDEILNNEISLSKAPVMDVLRFDIESHEKGTSPVLPAVSLVDIDGKKVPQIMGAAIIKNDKLAGYLDGEETRNLVFIRNEIKGGILTEEIEEDNQATSVSLEIFDNKTKVAPSAEGNEIRIDLNIEPTVAIDEISGPGDFLNEAGLKMLENNAETILKAQIEALIKKVQSEYDADIFRFGATLWEDNPQAFKSVDGHWDEIFKNLKVNVMVKVTIKNSAEFAKPVGEGE